MRFSRHNSEWKKRFKCWPKIIIIVVTKFWPVTLLIWKKKFSLCIHRINGIENSQQQKKTLNDQVCILLLDTKEFLRVKKNFSFLNPILIHSFILCVCVFFLLMKMFLMVRWDSFFVFKIDFGLLSLSKNE